MKLPLVSAVLSIAIAGMGHYALAAVVMPIARGPEYNPDIRPRYLSTRATISSTLFNNITRGSYYVEVEIGTPPQSQTLFVDTGSSDVWLLDSDADLCSSRRLQAANRGGCGTTFTSSMSSTFATVREDQFDISYLDGTGASGDYVSDTLTIAGVSVKGLQMGLARQATIGSGLMGIGYSLNEASNSRRQGVPFVYPSVIDTMLNQSLITRRAYSLYLNSLQSSTGSIIFGGLDTHKFSGDLLELPVLPSTYPNGTEAYFELVVVMTSLSITGQQGNIANLTKAGYKEPVLLDSGTTFSYLSSRLVKSIYNSIDAIDDSNNSGLILVDCTILQNSPSLTFNFGFGTAASGVTIKVPLNELVFPLNSLLNLTKSDLPRNTPWPSTCAFGIYTTGESEPSILGDSFMRSAYVVYDLDSNVIALAQTNFNSTSSSIVEFKADATGIPNVSGVANSNADVTQSAGALLPGIGVRTSSSTAATATGTGAGAEAVRTSDTKKSAAAGSVPAFDVSTLIILGVSSTFAVMGSAWFLSL
ncbi:Acid protease [Venustampulla echinocandica]|uniref:Acid protease n=1 Tax=Venustampulla echinocandica TaxID=2656787 RepID=A0A370TKT2_9HELO|nr:Acid protease [Venustampulla echinocandica]RDL36107.1 Acid protease [Venustampulla echinocandica]